MGRSVYIGLFFHFLLLVSALEEETYSDKFIMKTNLSEPEVRNLAAKSGFELKKKVFDGYYLLKKRESLPRLSKKPTRLANSTLKRHPMIERFEQEVYLKRYKRQIENVTAIPATSDRVELRAGRAPVITDDLWAYMWYMQKSRKPSMGIYEAWSRGYTGSGVTVAFLDDGIESRHTDLRTNFQSDLSYNYIYDKQSPEHSSGDDGHGSMCAGIVSAEKNNFCVLGVAYNTKFAALKILDYKYSHTASDEALALTHKQDWVDIYSNSWGPSDDGDMYGSPPEITEKALRTGVFEGRNGKGSIYVWSAGNGNKNGDDCNCDGYANSIYTIAIGSLSDTLKPAYYSEPCTAVMATTYGGDYPNPMIVTTNRSDTCTKEFQGTSAAAPMATGIIALTLEANPDLTWRDVMHLIVETSSNDGLYDPEEGFIVNGAGKKVSRYTGFGLMNAEAMITRALTWHSVPGLIVVQIRDRQPESRYGTVTKRLHIDSTIKYIEHVTIRISFMVNVRGHAVFHLTSPNGTRCKLLGSRKLDNTRMYQTGYFTFSSVQTWRENPEGLWKLEMASAGYFEEVEIRSCLLSIYGTVTDPLKGTPPAGSYGGECLPDNSCTGSSHCCDEDIDKCMFRYSSKCKQGNNAVATLPRPGVLCLIYSLYLMTAVFLHI